MVKKDFVSANVKNSSINTNEVKLNKLEKSDLVAIINDLGEAREERDIYGTTYINVYFDCFTLKLAEKENGWDVAGIELYDPEKTFAPGSNIWNEIYSLVADFRKWLLNESVDIDRYLDR